ncbi:MAG TPA: DUF402 domain-containing protein [Candidatus Limnocylindria bacterium]|nr:DUF402 domain-containing protein [Candidatus Limnocylindria bacterium]
MASQTRAPITERKTRLDGSVSEFVCQALVVDPPRSAAVRYVADREWAIAGTDLRVQPGTVTVGHFWADRPYNVYQWLVDGRTLAYYCNVATDTVIADGLVAYTDLVIDVLLMPSGAATVLDEDELPSDVAPAHRLAIARALEAIMTDPRRLIREVEQATAEALRRG